MKIEINTDQKTIILKDSIKIQELLDFLDDAKMDSDEWTIEVEKTIINSTPWKSDFDPINPWTPIGNPHNPYNPSPYQLPQIWYTCKT